MYQKIKKPILNYKARLLLGVLLLLVFYFQQIPSVKFLAFSLLSGFTLFLIILLLASIKLKWLKYLLTAIFSSILVIDVVCAIIYNSRVNENILAAIFETSTVEATGMLGEIVLPALVITVITFAIVFTSIEESKKVDVPVFKTLFFYFVSLISLAAISIIDASYQTNKSTESAKMEFRFDVTREKIADNPSYTLMNILSPRLNVFYSDILGSLYYLKEKYNYKHYWTQERVLAKGMSYLEEDNDVIDKIFLIIGESASSLHFSVYGYPTLTTPFLEELKVDNTSSYHQYSAITSQLFTRYSVRLMLSSENVVSQQETFFENKNIIELANDAGYETLWISNQSMLGPYDGFIPIIASCADHRIHNVTGNKSPSIRLDDKELIPIIKQNYREKKKQFFIIHLEGSHRVFKDRYDEVDLTAIEGRGDVVEYDRTIHHTDRFLKELYSIMPTNSTMLYLSDHGENPESTSGRFDIERGNQAFQIPFILINNEVSKDLTTIVESYKAEDIEQINNANTYYIMAEFMGYKVSEELRQQLKKESKFVQIPGEGKIGNINDPFVPLN